MASAALQQLESLLQTRQLDRTLARAWLRDYAITPTGLGALDAALDGGWRQGAISEIVGPPSSGRTRVLMASLATVTQEGGLAALVDPADAFDPIAAAAAGVKLDRLLWVRGATDVAARSAAFQRAVRAFDLLMRAGGFALVALDAADVPARALHDLPHTTWMRIAHANEGRATVGLLVGAAPIGRSASGVTLHLDAHGRWTGTSAQRRRLAGLDIRARLSQARRTSETSRVLLPCA